jgi:hypothetical protein
MFDEPEARHAWRRFRLRVEAAVQGVLLGLLYLATGRNLLAPIAAHCTADNCDFITIYLGLHPGITS